MDELDFDMDTEFSDMEDASDIADESVLDMLSDVQEDLEIAENESVLDRLPDVPDDDLELDEDIGPVLAKTYDGWGTVFPSDVNSHNLEGDKNLEQIYDNVFDNINDNEDLSNDEKIRQLESLKEQWLSEFE